MDDRHRLTLAAKGAEHALASESEQGHVAARAPEPARGEFGKGGRQGSFLADRNSSVLARSDRRRSHDNLRAPPCYGTRDGAARSVANFLFKSRRLTERRWPPPPRTSSSRSVGKERQPPL